MPAKFLVLGFGAAGRGDEFGFDRCGRVSASIRRINLSTSGFTAGVVQDMARAKADF